MRIFVFVVQVGGGRSGEWGGCVDGVGWRHGAPDFFSFVELGGRGGV